MRGAALSGIAAEGLETEHGHRKPDAGEPRICLGAGQGAARPRTTFWWWTRPGCSARASSERLCRNGGGERRESGAWAAIRSNSRRSRPGRRSARSPSGSAPPKSGSRGASARPGSKQATRELASGRIGGGAGALRSGVDGAGTRDARRRGDGACRPDGTAERQEQSAAKPAHADPHPGQCADLNDAGAGGAAPGGRAGRRPRAGDGAGPQMFAEGERMYFLQKRSRPRGEERHARHAGADRRDGRLTGGSAGGAAGRRPRGRLRLEATMPRSTTAMRRRSTRARG